MKTLIIVIVGILVLSFLYGLQITFNPFRIEFLHWKRLVGLLLVGVGIAIISIDDKQLYELRGFSDGAQRMRESFIKTLKDDYYIIRKDSIHSVYKNSVENYTGTVKPDSIKVE